MWRRNAVTYPASLWMRIAKVTGLRKWHADRRMPQKTTELHPAPKRVRLDSRGRHLRMGRVACVAIDGDVSCAFTRWAVQRLCGEVLFDAAPPESDAYSAHAGSVICRPLDTAVFPHEWVCRVHLDTPPADILAPDQEESYSLWVGGDGVRIRARTTWGALHAVTTLKQLIAVDGEHRATAPFCEIRDAPACAHRGVVVDARGGLTDASARPSQLRELVDLMGYVKLNALRLRIDAQSHPPELVDRLRIYAMRRGVRVLLDFPTSMNGHYLHLNKVEWMCVNEQTEGGIPRLDLPSETEGVLDGKGAEAEWRWRSYVAALRERFRTMLFLMDAQAIRHHTEQRPEWMTTHADRVVCIADPSADGDEVARAAACGRCVLVTHHSKPNTLPAVSAAMGRVRRLVGFEEQSARTHNVVAAGRMSWAGHHTSRESDVRIIHQMQAWNPWVHSEHAMDKIDPSDEEFRIANEYRQHVLQKALEGGSGAKGFFR